jgi:hypothetical protein
VHQRDGIDQPADGRALDTSYTITSNTLDTSGCTSLAESSNCVHAAHTCTDNTPVQDDQRPAGLPEHRLAAAGRGPKRGRFLLGVVGGLHLRRDGAER